MDHWHLTRSLIVLVFLTTKADSAPHGVIPVLGQNETILTMCAVNSTQHALEITWKVGSLKNTVRTLTIPPDVSGTVTSYLIGAGPIDDQQRAVQCVIRHPDMDIEKTISYVLETTSPAREVKVCSLENPTQSPVFQWNEDALPRVGQSLPMTEEKKEFEFGCHRTKDKDGNDVQRCVLEMGSFATVVVMAALGGVAIVLGIILAIYKCITQQGVI